MSPGIENTSRRRGRPRSVARTSDLDPREEILRHAALLFSANGLGAVRLSDIAASVGVSAPAIYHWFENLDAIVGALLDYVVDESAAFATAAADSSGTASERLHSLVRQHVERLTSGPYDLWFVAGMSSAESRRFAAVGRKATQWRRAVARLVAEGAERHEFRATDPALALAAISGLVYGALQLRHQHGAVDADDVATLAVSSFRSR